MREKRDSNPRLLTRQANTLTTELFSRVYVGNTGFEPVTSSL